MTINATRGLYTIHINENDEMWNPNSCRTKNQKARKDFSFRWLMAESISSMFLALSAFPGPIRRQKLAVVMQHSPKPILDAVTQR